MKMPVMNAPVLRADVLLSDDGALHLPSSLLKFVGFKPGDSITIETQDGCHLELSASASYDRQNAPVERYLNQQRALRDWIFNDESGE